jgi:hypothetical protein
MLQNLPRVDSFHEKSGKGREISMWLNKFLAQIVCVLTQQILNIFGVTNLK